MIDVKIPAGALVMVGDGKRALFLRNTGTVRHVDLLTERVLEIENPPTHEQGSDRPGRYMAGNGARRVAACVVAEVAKDLTSRSLPELTKLLC